MFYSKYNKYRINMDKTGCFFDPFVLCSAVCDDGQLLGRVVQTKWMGPTTGHGGLDLQTTNMYNYLYVCIYIYIYT